jgi:heat shock protein 1/8
MHYSFADVSSTSSAHFSSAPVVNLAGFPGFKVETSGQESALTAQQVAVTFLSTIFRSAEDFIGHRPDRVVFAVPDSFAPSQIDALKEASSEAGIQVSQVIDMAQAALLAYDLSPSAGKFAAPPVDRNVAVVDVGARTTSVSVYAVRDRLYTPLSVVRDEKLGGEAFDDKLVTFFLGEFAKKTKVTVTDADVRSKTKIRLAVETTKRSLSASSSASCSVESLKDGLDFHGSITRLRFDLLVGPVYAAIASRLSEAVEKAGLDPLDIQEVVLAGGSTRLPGVAARLEEALHPDVVILSSIDPDEVVAKGAVLQARLLAAAADTPEDLAVANNLNPVSAPHLSRPVGLVFPTPDSADGNTFVTVVPGSTPLPTRRVVELPVAAGAKEVVLSLWEGEYDVKVEKPTPAAANGAPNGSHKTGGEDEDEEEEEEEERRYRIVRPIGLLAETKVPTEGRDKIKVTVIIGNDARGSIEAQGGSGEVMF